MSLASRSRYETIDDAGDAYSASLVRRDRTRRRSFVRREPTEPWSRSGSVITRLRTLKGSPLDLALAVEVLEAYIEAKRRKGRDEAGVAKRLEAIRHATPSSLSDAFAAARQQIDLPLAWSTARRIPQEDRSDADFKEPKLAPGVSSSGSSQVTRLSGIFSPSRDQALQPGLPSFLIARDNEESWSRTLPVQSGIGSLPFKVHTRSMSMSGFRPFVLDPWSDAQPDSAVRQAVEGDELDMRMLSEFPSPPTHTPTPAPTPRRRIAEKTAVSSWTYDAAAAPSAWSLDSSSSDEMPTTPGPSTGGARCLDSANVEDDARTITGVTGSNDDVASVSRTAMELHADDVFLVGLSTADFGVPKSRNAFGWRE